MHTTVISKRVDEQHGVVADGDVRVHHHSDWSGTAEIQWSEGISIHRADLPGWVTRELVYFDSIGNDLARPTPRGDKP